MRIYFSGIGGVGIGPLAMIAQDAGYDVYGSDQTAGLMTDELSKHHISVTFDQSGAALEKHHATQKIDWLIHTAGLPHDHPELQTARALGIRIGKRDELLAHIIQDKGLKLIAIAGTHGKTTTTGMMIWALKQLGVPVSYSVGSTLSFGASGAYDPSSELFVYECDEFDRNFLHFHPWVSLITSIDYDHPDTYPTESDYCTAFTQFIAQSRHTFLWKRDADTLQTLNQLNDNLSVLDGNQPSIKQQLSSLALPGQHNRENACLVLTELLQDGFDSIAIQKALESFPGTSRRFERIADNLYSDYGHHPVEIAATLQMAREINEHVVLVYQPHQNIRQHEVRNQYTTCMEQAEVIYWLPTYLTREDPNLPILSPQELTKNLTNRSSVQYADLDDTLWHNITMARKSGKLVLCMGAGTIDDWLRMQYKASKTSA